MISRRSVLAGTLATPHALHIAGAATGTLVAGTVYGKVRGAETDGVYIFRGLPYGGPTEGAGRFMPPSKPQPWTGVRDATVPGPQCVQPSSGNVFTSPLLGEYFGGGRSGRLELTKQPMSENCLAVNVLTKGLSGKRPVMVYIHGGGFTSQSSLLTLFADRHVREQDIVLVGINHRLGILGYSYFGGISEKFATGNAGQLDLVAALKWVRENIANFGGDPENVTLFGESGGGAKISTLMGMPAAKGLFHKAIVQSGSLLRVGDAESATKAARALMARLHVTKPEDLQSIPVQTLIAPVPGEKLSIGPVLDGQSIRKQTWDPTAPLESAGIPFLVGNCKDESTLFTKQNPDLDEAGLKAAIRQSGVPEERVGALLALYRRNHPREKPVALLSRFATDRVARRNALRQAELKVAEGKSNVFVYYFQWDTPVDGGRIRAFHTADLPLEMRLTLYPESEKLSRQLSAAWANFARTGNPSQKALAWPAYTLERRSTMMFDVRESRALDDPDREVRLMLEGLPNGGLL